MNTILRRDLSVTRRFPEGFLWGVGTSSYQIEGGVAADGRGRSIWDVFAHTPGKVFRGDTGDIACDSYNRIEDDVRMVNDLGVGAYRFSVSWPRVQPSGGGAVNQAGLDYYRRLAEQLQGHGIRPVVTVYHWDLPQALQDQGGWANRDTAYRLGELAQILGEALNDLVGMWITVNEPLQAVNQGYRMGTHAPGLRDQAQAAAATHHLLLGHGLALAALRAATRPETLLGVTADPDPYIALDPAAEPVAQRLYAEFNGVYLDPIFKRCYPSAARPSFVPAPELIHDGDFDLIGAPIDFFGVNYYRPHLIRSGDWSALLAGEQPIEGSPGFVEFHDPAAPRTVMNWSISPSQLHSLLVDIDQQSGGLPLYITENGCAADDYISPEGTIDDYERIDFIECHLDAALAAIEDGVKLAGYFHWSLMDNFEWAEGYRRRFGLHYVDFETGRRTPKRSAHFYGEVARTGQLPSRAGSVPPDGPVRAISATPTAG